MALSALKPGGVIHPLAGSLFSTPKPGPPFQTSAIEERFVPRDSREASQESVVAAPIAPRSEIGPRTSADPSSNIQRPTLIASSQPAQASSPISGRVGPPRADPMDTTDDVDRDRRVAPAATACEIEANAVMRAHSPLIPVALAPNAPTPTSRLPAASAESTRPVAWESHASDEIEIHIGRIEISAVQPAPARPVPAKSKQRPASLDEYLRRRDGRPS